MTIPSKYDWISPASVEEFNKKWGKKEPSKRNWFLILRDIERMIKNETTRTRQQPNLPQRNLPNIPAEAGRVVGMTTIKGEEDPKTGIRPDIIILACEHCVFKITKEGMEIVKFQIYHAPLG